jgi:hypothetical protein
MEQIGTINSIYSLIAFVIFYGCTELVKYLGRRKTSSKDKKTLQTNFLELKTQMDSHIASDAENHKNIKLQIKRLELLNLIHHSPDKKKQIERVYVEYKDLGGNSYIDDVYDEWEKQGKGKKAKAKVKAEAEA